MTTFVVSVTPETTIADAARVMLDRRISGLPAIDGAGKLVGVVSEGDLLRRVEAHTERKRPRWLELLSANSPNSPARLRQEPRPLRADVMTTERRITAGRGVNAPLVEIAELLEKRRGERVPILAGARSTSASVSPLRRAARGRQLGAAGDRRRRPGR